MAEYVVLECLDCKYKNIYVNGTSDGKRCERCNSGLFFPIDGGSKKELVLRHDIKKKIIAIQY